mgnify:CR=1 FL=1
MNWMGILIAALNGDPVDYDELVAACEYIVAHGLVASLGNEMASIVNQVLFGGSDD